MATYTGYKRMFTKILRLSKITTVDKNSFFPLICLRHEECHTFFFEHHKIIHNDCQKPREAVNFVSAPRRMSSVSVKMSMIQQEWQCVTRMAMFHAARMAMSHARECQCFRQRECQYFSDNVNVSAVTSMSQCECQRLSENVSVNVQKKNWVQKKNKRTKCFKFKF